MNNTITSSIKNIIGDLEIEISEKQKCVDLLKTLDLSKPITEKVWQEVCNTSLRKNEAAMEVLAKSTFPEAKDIVVGGNYVKFMLHNFVCYILTDRWDGVKVYTRYKKYAPKNFDEFTEHRYQKTMDFLKIKHPSIIDRVQFLYGESISPKDAINIYFNNPKRVRRGSNVKRLKNNLEKWLGDYQQYLDVYLNRYLDSLCIAEKLENELLPELHQFSDNIREATGGSHFSDQYSIQDIIKWSHETSGDVARSHIQLLKTNKMFIDKEEV